jgi:hypothetical protein
MGRKAENAKKFIISCRVNNEEIDQLQCLAREQGTNVSDLMRKSLILLQGDPESVFKI